VALAGGNAMHQNGKQAGIPAAPLKNYCFILLATSFEHRIFSREVTAQFADENLIIIL
jgi:hypothetical protein